MIGSVESAWSVFDPSHYALSVYAVAPAVTTALALALGIGVLIRERFSYVSVCFLLVALSIAAWLFSFSWMYCASDARAALWWAKAAYVGVPLIPTTIYQFTVAVLRLTPHHQRFVRASWIVSLLYVVEILRTDLLVSGLYRYWWGYYPRYGWLSVPYLIFFFGLMVVSLRLYWVEYHKAAPNTIHQHRVRTFLLAFSIVYLGSFDYIAKYGIALYPFGFIPVLGFLVLAARAIKRYRLVDITPSFAAQEIISTMANALIVLDNEGIIRIVNQQACALLGKPQRELVGSVLAIPSAPPLTAEALHALLRDGALRYHELTLAANGGQKTLSLSASIMRDPQQQVVGMVCVLNDITERERAEQQLEYAHTNLKKSYEELKAAHLQLIRAAKMESVGRLAAGVAHEVKNPLAIILQGVDYLASRVNGDADSAMVLKYTADAVRRADSVIKGLLDFSATRELDIKPEDVNAVVDEALLLVKHELDRAHITLVKDLTASLPAPPMDRNKIAQVFVNILMNAIQAMPDGGTLTVRTHATQLTDVGFEIGERQEDRFKVGETVVVVEVDDTGPGIPEDALPKVFDPFFSTKPTGKGTGLGLTVTKKIIELHHGTIDIQNRSEGGVRAIIMLKTEGGEGDGHQETYPHH